MRAEGRYSRTSALRMLGIALMVALLPMMVLLNVATSSLAQEESLTEETAETEMDVEEPVDDESPSAADDAPTDNSSGAADGTPQQTLLRMLWLSGWCGFFIVICSIVSVAFIVEHALTIRRGRVMPDEVVEELDALIQQGRIDEAAEACRNTENDSLISSVVLAGLERYQGSEFGFAEYRAAAEEAGEEQTSRMYRKTEVLAVIGAIAPMLGLLGTVSGMIAAFNVIASTKGMARPDQLAAGISEALITTYMGLIVAIPTMIAFSYFRNKIDSLVAEAGKRAEQILMPLGRRRGAPIHSSARP